MNYPTHDLELEVVVLSLKLWRHYFNEVHVDVFTDHKSLQYVFTQRELNLHQRKWLEMLKNYDMNVHYHPGKANVVADALRRMSMGSTSHVENERKSWRKMYTYWLDWVCGWLTLLVKVFQFILVMNHPW